MTRLGCLQGFEEDDDGVSDVTGIADASSSSSSESQVKFLGSLRGSQIVLLGFHRLPWFSRFDLPTGMRINWEGECDRRGECCVGKGG